MSRWDELKKQKLGPEQIAASGEAACKMAEEDARRLRPFPSREAQAAHPGKWMCVCEGHIVVGRFDRPDHFLHGEHAADPGETGFRGYSLEKEICEAPAVLFWPVDEYGNKLERFPLEPA